MKVSLSKGSKTELSTLVVFAAKDKKAGTASVAKLGADLSKLLAAAVEAPGFTGGAKETVFFRHCNCEGYKNILFVGLGSQVDAEAVRAASAVAYSALKAQKVVSAGYGADTLTKHFKDPGIAVQAAAEGIFLAAYEFTIFKTKGKDAKDIKPKLDEISFLFANAPSAALQKSLQRAEILTECQNFARYLGDNPGNYMTPTILADETVKAAKGTGLKVTVWDKARIVKERFGGLLSVSLGSTQDPRFIIMEYKGAAASQKPVVFVGKGLTFDCGGISIKPAGQMEEMKYDMCGGAAVIGTLLALAKLKAKVNVIGLVPSTENLVGPAAIKPGDIYYGRNGKTVEVYNTDAEGRLILGDALAYGSEQKPAAMFDAATLTGAILIALGNTYTGVFTRDKKLRQRIQEASDQTGEWVWAMPLDDFHVEDMKGTAADLCNIAGGRLAGSSTAAGFLEEFVGEGIPWAHFDIAGTAWNIGGRWPYHPKKGGSGIMVRTFVELAESY